MGTVRPWADEPLRVHRGVDSLYRGLCPNVIECMERSPVHTICGHSLGGAFALLCALR